GASRCRAQRNLGVRRRAAVSAGAVRERPGRPLPNPPSQTASRASEGGTDDLGALVADPRRALDVPMSAVPGLLTAASAERERIAVVECALLARLAGTEAERLAASTPEPTRSRTEPPIR